MRHRPSAIDRFLTRHPERRDVVEAWAIDPGITVDEFVTHVESIGCKTSRSAASRFRVRYHHRRPGPVADARLRLLQLVATLDDSAVDRLLEQLAQGNNSRN